MTFADLAAGSTVFVDANTFVYHFTRHPQLAGACTLFLERVGRSEVVAFTSTHVLSEVAHRVMTIEAITAFGWPAAGIAQRLRRHPDELQKLKGFRQAVDEVPRFGVQVLTIPPPMIAVAATLSQQAGLLSNDALIVALMRENGIAALASNDVDFDRVQGIIRYAPN